MDDMVRLEIFAREANIPKQHFRAIFFNLEMMYKATWKYGIMEDLHNLQLKDRLSNIINIKNIRDLFETIDSYNMINFLKKKLASNQIYKSIDPNLTHK